MIQWQANLREFVYSILVKLDLGYSVSCNFIRVVCNRVTDVRHFQTYCYFFLQCGDETRLARAKSRIMYVVG